MLYNLISTYLLSQSTLTDLVGQDIYPQKPADSATLPFILQQIGDTEPTPMLGKKIIAKPLMLFHIHALTLVEITDIKNVLIGLLHGWKTADIHAFNFNSLADPDGDIVDETYIYKRTIRFVCSCDLAII